MSQGELAELVKVTRPTVNKWESGKVNVPIPRAVAIYLVAKMAQQGIRDREQLREELGRLMFTGANGLTRGIDPSPECQTSMEDA